MEYLPIFAEVKERPVLVIGGGEIAARKITFLLRAEAKVLIVAEKLIPELAGKIERQEIKWRASAANERYQLVNVVDNQPLWRWSLTGPAPISK